MCLYSQPCFVTYSDNPNPSPTKKKKRRRRNKYSNPNDPNLYLMLGDKDNNYFPEFSSQKQLNEADPGLLPMLVSQTQNNLLGNFPELESDIKGKHFPSCFYPILALNKNDTGVLPLLVTFIFCAMSLELCEFSHICFF